MMEKFTPDMYQKSIYHINYDKLKEDGIKCLLFDLDNTCVPYVEKKPNQKLKDLFDKASEYAKSKGYTTLRTGMSSMDFNIDGKELVDIPAAISSLETNRIDYKWLLDYGFKVIGIHPNAYGNNSHVILFSKAL